jgi:hypothetical protein
MGILVHGCNTNVDNWDEIAWGADGYLAGRIMTVFRLLSYAEKDDNIEVLQIIIITLILIIVNVISVQYLSFIILMIDTSIYIIKHHYIYIRLVKLFGDRESKLYLKMSLIINIY